MEWYYEKRGEQCGPTSEVDLKGMYGRAELTPKTLIWREGMSDWASYGSIFEVGEEHLLPPTRLERTQLGNSIADLRAEARSVLAGNWLMAALITFVLQLLQQVSGILSIIPVLGLIAPFFVIGPLTVGYHAYILGVLRGESVDLSTLFDGFQQWMKSAGLILLTTFILFMASAIAAIPGVLCLTILYDSNSSDYTEDVMFYVSFLILILPVVIVAAYVWFSFIMVYFIANDERELPVTKILGRSRSMMNGQIWKFCCLMFSFIGWHILGILTFGIGLFWSLPYMFTAIAAFYDDLRDAAV